MFFTDSQHAFFYDFMGLVTHAELPDVPTAKVQVLPYCVFRGLAQCASDCDWIGLDEVWGSKSKGAHSSEDEKEL
eukprot:5389441-Lingulodinium_polyedra.AAC.1